MAGVDWRVAEEAIYHQAAGVEVDWLGVAAASYPVEEVGHYGRCWPDSALAFSHRARP